jgi:hypothetical protein
VGAAEKLFERMKRTKSGWGENDFRTLYTGYGFSESEGSKHLRFAHPRFPDLYATVARQRSLPPGYAQTAVRLITRLQDLEGGDHGDESGDEDEA